MLPEMIKNYITIAIRNITRNPVYAAINILGLTIGIICSLLLFLYINYEMNYDSFHEKKDRIFRVVSSAVIQDTKLVAPVTMEPMGAALQNDYSEVEHFCRVRARGEVLITIDDERFLEDKIYVVDSSFFEVFTFEVLKGNAKTCLVEPNSIVLTKTLADKYFPDQDPIGQIIKTGSAENTRKVTAIMAGPPQNSHITPNGLVSFSSFPINNFWGNLSDYTYVVLKKGVDYQQFNEYFPAVYDKYVKELFDKFNAYASFYLQPMTDIYLNSNLENELETVGNMAYLYVFGAIGLFMLLVACINYMNLATARSATRSREVGIRKALGSYRRQLIGQFITESIVITLFAAALSLIIVFFLIPSFNDLANVNIPMEFLTEPMVVAMVVVLVVFVGLIGGSYPSLYLSHFRPAEVLKGKSGKKGGSESLRRVLVISQFSISLIMIISTWIVFQQLNYLSDKDLGFNKDRVAKINISFQDAQQKYDVLRNKFLEIPNVESVASSYGTPGGENLNMSGIFVETEDGEMIEKIFQNIRVDHQYLPTLEIPIVQGRNFLETVGNDTATAVIVNEKMVEEMAWSEPIGMKFHAIINQELETREVKVVGVCKNFHMRALQAPIEPLLIYNTINNGQILVRMSGNNLSETISLLEGSFKDVIQNKPFEYNFLDQEFQEQYEADQKRGQVFAIFSVLTIAIACLGLFGLASFTAESRRKEIGVRKVIGASIGRIILMMSVDFLKLVALSIIVAFPVAYYFMNRWLNEFAFRIDIEPLSFVLSALLMALIAFGTVFYHSLKSAISNPATSLRED